MKVWINEKYLVCREGKIQNMEKGNFLKPTKCVNGYVVVGTKLGGGLHRILGECFLGGIPEGMVINHLDGDKHNNQLSNLEITTHRLNTVHAYESGLANGLKGEQNSQAKVTEEQVLEMYELMRQGFNNEQIGEQYGLHSRYVSLIRHKKRWTHLAPIDDMPKSFNFKNPIEDILLAWDLIQAGERNIDVAEETGIEKSMISRIRSGKSYAEFIKLHRSCND